MNNQEKTQQLVSAIRGGVTEVLRVISQIREGFLECASQLRIEQNQRTFNALSVRLDNMEHLVVLVGELKNGLNELSSRGYNVSSEGLSTWDKSLPLFKEMLTAFEHKDWITLSDLIEYELEPFLIEGEKGFSALLEDMKGF